MKTIYKYPLVITDRQEIKVPKDAKFIHVDMQSKNGGVPEMNLWCEVETENRPSPRTIYIFGTGHPMPSDVKLEYINSVQMMNGSLVWHIYEEQK